MFGSEIHSWLLHCPTRFISATFILHQFFGYLYGVSRYNHPSLNLLYALGTSILTILTLKLNWNKPGGTVQQSPVYLGSEYLVLSFLTSLNHQLFKNIAYVGYFGHFVICCICVFVYLRICICVFVYLTVKNIIFDVLGPLAFQKYSIIRFF